MVFYCNQNEIQISYYPSLSGHCSHLPDCLLLLIVLSILLQAGNLFLLSHSLAFLSAQEAILPAHCLTSFLPSCTSLSKYYLLKDAFLSHSNLISYHHPLSFTLFYLHHTTYQYLKLSYLYVFTYVSFLNKI